MRVANYENTLRDSSTLIKATYNKIYIILLLVANLDVYNIHIFVSVVLPGGLNFGQTFLLSNFEIKLLSSH